jgi:hypothetical protein
MPSHSESGINDRDRDSNCVHSPAPYQDPSDRPESPGSPSPGDNDYEPDMDNRLGREDNDVSGDDDDDDDDSRVAPPSNGRKRAHSNSFDTDNDSDNMLTRARKLVKSKGRPKASDYADDVRDVLDNAIMHFKVDLLRVNPYPDHTHELEWAKVGWAAANMMCDLKIAHNSELIKMVSLITTRVRLCLYFTSRSHAVDPICVAKSRQRSNRLLPACTASRFPQVKPFVLGTANSLKNSRKGTRFYTRSVTLCYALSSTDT